MAPKYGSADDDAKINSGGAAMRQKPPAPKPQAQTQLDKDFKAAMEWLNKDVGRSDSNYKNYKALLETIKKDSKGRADTFNACVETLKTHVDLKSQIAEEFSDDAAVRKQLLYDLSLAYKKFAKSPKQGAAIYEGVEASVQRQVMKKGTANVATDVYAAGEMVRAPAMGAANIAEAPAVTQGDLQAMQQIQDSSKVEEQHARTPAQENGLSLYAFRAPKQDGASFQLRQETEDGYKALGTSSFTNRNFEDLVELAQRDPSSLTINKVGSEYEVLYEGRRVTLKEAQMATLLASSGRTIGEFNKMDNAQRISLFQQSALSTVELGRNAPVSEEAIDTTKPKKKKNFLEQILEYIKNILNVFMLWTAITKVLELVGLKKKDKSSQEAESEARSLYYTMNTLNSAYGRFDRDLENLRK